MVHFVFSLGIYRNFFPELLRLALSFSVVILFITISLISFYLYSILDFPHTHHS